MSTNKKGNITGNIFGGLAAMLVAFPSAIAYGIVAFSPLGTGLSSAGALTGILGAIVLGIIAPILGGAPRLISAPSAPAAAVLAAFATALLTGQNAMRPELIPLAFTLMAMIAALFQVGIGLSGGGKLIKFIPYPVVAGYLSGVGLIILMGQYPNFLGIPKETALPSLFQNPEMLSMPAILTGIVTIVTMVFSPKLTDKLPAPIIAILAGIGTYFALSFFYPHLLQSEGNKLVIGAIQSNLDTSFFTGIITKFNDILELGSGNIAQFIVPALTLAALLSIDTLKSAVIMDAMTRSRHNSNKELIAQGVGNTASVLLGGMPGSGTMGATLVNLNSGATSRLSGILEGVFSLLAFVVLGSLVAWVPLSALAGILIVIAFKMVDLHSFHLLKQKSTAFDFAVIFAVAVSALAFNLIVAAGVGVALAILLFVREQIRSSVVRRKLLGSALFSKKKRGKEEMTILETHGNETVIFQLQGALFFGTTDQLLTELEPNLKSSKYVILDMKKVTAVDYTAVRMLGQIESKINDNKGILAFANIPQSLPTGQNLMAYFKQLGLTEKNETTMVFPSLDDALEWAEDIVIGKYLLGYKQSETALLPEEINLFKGFGKSNVDELVKKLIPLSFATGAQIFPKGENSDELYFIRRGLVRIVLPMKNGPHYHLVTFGRGDFFGDMAFLDGSTRSADAIAWTDCELYKLSRKEFDELTITNPGIKGLLFERLSYILSLRLRVTDKELRALEDS